MNFLDGCHFDPVILLMFISTEIYITSITSVDIVPLPLFGGGGETHKFQVWIFG